MRHLHRLRRPPARLAWVLGALALLLHPATARALFFPYFTLSGLVLESDQVVVVRAPGALSGDLIVERTLHGTLAPGARLEIAGRDQLVTLGSQEERRVTCDETSPCPAEVSGHRMVLFLRNGARGGALSAAGMGGVRTSIAWLEGDRAFHYYDRYDYGRGAVRRLVPMGSVADLLETIARGIEAREALARARSAPTTEARLAALRALWLGPVGLRLDGQIGAQAHGAILAEGAAAVPLIREVLAERPATNFSHLALADLVQLLGPAVGPDLLGVVTRETEFWQATVPGLQPGWMARSVGVTEARRRELYAAVGLVLGALRALAPMHLAAAREPVTRLRAFWAAAPLLHDPPFLNEVTSACDSVLAGLGPQPPVGFDGGASR